MPKKYLFPILGTITILVILISSLTFAFRDKIFSKNEVSQNQKVETKTETSSKPEEKPTQEIVEKTEIKPLVADDTHDVIVLDQCDLAVRYEKKTDLKTSFNSQGFNLSEDLNNLRVDCVKSPYYSFFKEQESELTSISVDEKNKIMDTNFKTLLLQRDLVNQKEYVNQYFSKQKDQDILGGCNLYLNTSKYLYSISFSKNCVEGMNLGEFQFNSLAPSIPSVKVGDLQAGNKSTIVLDKCDLLVNFDTSKLMQSENKTKFELVEKEGNNTALNVACNTDPDKLEISKINQNVLKNLKSGYQQGIDENDKPDGKPYKSESVIIGDETKSLVYADRSTKNDDLFEILYRPKTKIDLLH